MKLATEVEKKLYLDGLMDRLRKLPHETEWVEFKINNCKPEEIGQYISALANSAYMESLDKAYLVFGIENETHKVKGTTFKPKQYKIGEQLLENWLATLLNPRIDFKIHEFEYNDLDLVLFEIDVTQNQPVSFSGEPYIRIGSYKKKLKDHPERARKIWKKSSEEIFEKEFALKNVSEDKVLELLDYPTYFSLIGRKLPSDKIGILDKLSEEQLIVYEENSYNITNLGAILLANNLNNFEQLGRKAVRVIFYKGNNKLETIKELEGRKGYAVGFSHLINFIVEQLPRNEVIEKALRKEVKVYPEIAIRELVANALIHQDFNITGTGPMIEIYNDRIEISNPGKPLISPLRFIDHHPQSRNEKLAALMRRMNVCEERGSGIDKVISNIELFQLPAPNFIEEQNFLKAIIYSPKTLRKMDKNDKIRACYQHACLKCVSNENMTNQSLRHRFNIEAANYSTVSRIISDTMSNDLIKYYDPEITTGKYVKYVPFWA